MRVKIVCFVKWKIVTEGERPGEPVGCLAVKGLVVTGIWQMLWPRSCANNHQV